MDFDCKRAQCMKKYCAYCCSFKRDLLKNNNFEKTIEILPRIIVCSKLEKCGSYCQPVTVRNTGTRTRRMRFIVEPNSDVSFSVKGNTDLISGASVTVDVYIEPITKKDLGRHRFFYVFTEHPDIVWEIPILLMTDPPEVFIPDHICLHKVPANTVSHYQFVLYNPLENDITFTTCTCFENFTLTPSTGTIPKQDYVKILLDGKIPGHVTTSSIVVTLSIGKSQRIFVHMEPTEQIAYLSNAVVTFEDSYMGIRSQQNITICNKSMENASFQWASTGAVENLKTKDENDELVISEFLRIRSRRGCISPLGSALAIITFFPPRDFEYSEEEEPPFKVNICTYLFCPILGPHSYRLQILASILGPDIDITPRDLDVGTIYFGQIQCISFKVENKGPIDGEIYFKENTDTKYIHCLIKPTSIMLKPKGTGTFAFTFYRRNIGKFLTKLTFKIRSGNSIPVLLRGNAEAALVKIWPESFELGVIPICIPQKRFALVANPLPVPIVVEPYVTNDGLDDPMVLCVDYSKLPLHSRPVTYYPDEKKDSFVEEDEVTYSDFELNKTLDAVTVTKSQLSWMFEDKVLDEIPAMAEELLKSVRVLNPQHQSEPGMKIIDAALDCILNRSDYFDDLKDKQNYMNIDWEELPPKAKEIAIEAERFYLKPNESKSFPIILIPNGTGPNTKVIEFKACPMGVESADLVTAVRSKNMVRSLSLEYKCLIPKIEFNDNIRVYKVLYVDLLSSLSMSFKNVDIVPGFLYFCQLPKGGKGIITMKEKKFFIPASHTVTAHYNVTFLISGIVTLEGTYRMIGKTAEFPFSVTAEILPPKLDIFPEKLINKQQVLETTRTSVVFENITPTIARFTVSLKCDRYQHLEPLGGALGPDQKILITVTSRFFDPGTYKNTLFLHVKHGERVNIPMTFSVEGTPVLFEPNLRLGLDCGTLFKSEKRVDYPFKVYNAGEKPYRLLIQKPKPKGNAVPPASIFCIDPTGLLVPAQTENIVTITVDISKETVAEEQYTVDGMGDNNCRFKFFSFVAKCTVIKSRVIWTKTEICLETGNENRDCDKKSDTVSLINTTPLPANVSINVIGCFVFTQTEKGPKEKTATFSLDGKAMKQFTVFLNEQEIEAHEICQCFKGTIKVKVNNKTQKPLPLHAKIVNPGLKICTPEVTLFTQNADSYAHIYIHNHGALMANFRWKMKNVAVTPATPVEAEEFCSKTISEMIFSLSDESALEIPEFIKRVEPEVYPSEEEPWTEDGEEEQSVTKPSPAESAGLSVKVKPSNAITTASKKSSAVRSDAKPSSLSDARVSTSSEKPKAPPCRPLKLLPSLHSPYLEAHQIDVPKILDHLGIRRAFKRSSVIDFFEGGDRVREDKVADAEESTDEQQVILFQTPSGTVLPKGAVKAYMFLPPVADGETLTSKFELEVLGGKSETLDVTLTSLKGRIQVSRNSVDLGRQPWFKSFTEHVALTNRGPYAVKLTFLETCDYGDIQSQLINGHVQVVSPKMFVLMPDAYICMETRTILGLRYNFIEDIGIEINNNSTGIPIRFEGSGLLPMITPQNLNKMARRSLDTITSYLTIRTVYETVQAKKSAQAHGSSAEVSSPDSKISFSFTVSGEGEGYGESIFGRKKSKRNVASDFVALNYSEDAGPKGLEIERLIETWKLLGELTQSQELRTKFHQFYCNCLYLNALELDSAVNLKLTICRPIPWDLPIFVLNMGNMHTNETKSFQLDLTFIGPGKMFLSARTRIAIPGLMAWFDDCPSIANPGCFVFFLQQPEERRLQRYRNMHERDTDDVESQENYRLPHAHSFDVDEEGVHKRIWGAPEAKKVKERYTKMTQAFKERKNPLILAEVCQTTNDNWDNTTFKLTLLFTATGSYYENTQLIEDFLYIDMHLGPTLPILLRGRVITTESSDI